RGVVGVDPEPARREADRTIHRAAVDVRVAERGGEPARRRALSRPGRAVDGDDVLPSRRLPSPRCARRAARAVLRWAARPGGNPGRSPLPFFPGGSPLLLLPGPFPLLFLRGGSSPLFLPAAAFAALGYRHAVLARRRRS